MIATAHAVWNNLTSTLIGMSENAMTLLSIRFERQDEWVRRIAELVIDFVDRHTKAGFFWSFAEARHSSDCLIPSVRKYSVKSWPGIVH